MNYHSFTVLPKTPEKLTPLLYLAKNMWYAWNWDVRNLFTKLDSVLWEQCGKNPIKMLCEISQETLAHAAENENFVKELDAVYFALRNYLESKTWYEEEYGATEGPQIAYFSCEYGIHESLPIYSGGLGILSGDHLKSASDMGIPLVAVGLFYSQGYFRQGLDARGYQLQFYPENEWFYMPVELVKDDHNLPRMFQIQIAESTVYYQIWKVAVGRVSLYLLDCNVEQNNQEARDITKRLYDADRDVRIRQEILLGMGGINALEELGIRPKVYHLNEGHSAFLVIERMRKLIHQQHLSWEEAHEFISATTLFTTHTPVPAGNERFAVDLIKKYFARYVQQNFHISWKEFLGFGRMNPDDDNEEYCMTVVALKFASFANGVAKLHGKVSRDMWKDLYKGIPLHEVPIGHVTNGVHTRTWLSQAMERLYARYTTTSYVKEVADFSIWKVVDEIPDGELWQAHLQRKKNLIDYARERVRFQLRRRQACASELNKVNELLDPTALTIGFARRFAPYKRGTLLFKDLDRLAKIISNAKMPVQFIFAGKAHPADENGKALIKKIFEFTNTPEFKNRVVLLEDYDMDMGKALVKGVDVWLNTPLRPLEASGTSGMKVGMNGGLNLSILDGWWDEGYNGLNGWAIGSGEMAKNSAEQDEIDARILYDLIEKEVAPLYYKRDEMNHPVSWIKMMKNAIKTVGENFNAHRMLKDYVNQYYSKAEKFYDALSTDNYRELRDLAKWKTKMSNIWEQVQIVNFRGPGVKDQVFAGGSIPVEADIRIGEFGTENLVVEVYYGALDTDGHIKNSLRKRMQVKSRNGDLVTYETQIPCFNGGRYSYTVRVLPGHKNLAAEFIPKMIKWG